MMYTVSDGRRTRSSALVKEPGQPRKIENIWRPASYECYVLTLKVEAGRLDAGGDVVAHASVFAVIE